MTNTNRLAVGALFLLALLMLVATIPGMPPEALDTVMKVGVIIGAILAVGSSAWMLAVDANDDEPPSLGFKIVTLAAMAGVIVSFVGLTLSMLG